MIDSHCHLAASQFAQDVDAVIARAVAAGVTHMVCIGDTIEESERGLQLAKKNEHIFCTVGMHPHHAKDVVEGTYEKLRTLAVSSKRVRGIGEVGLDYHYDFSPRDSQQAVFRQQLTIANELDLPVVVHCREAVEDVWNIIDELKPKTMVVHCCTETWEDVERFVQRGYMLSFTGIATYPKSDDIRNTIKHCPLDQLMIETDAPFLAPVPYRGKRNEPAFVVEVAKCIAEIKGLSLQEVDEATTKNAVEFFDLK